LLWLVFLVLFLSLNQSFPGAATGIICTGKIIEDIFINEPGIMDFVSWDITLAAKPFYRLRVDFEESAGFQDI
jgi:hypothetical protein